MRSRTRLAFLFTVLVGAVAAVLPALAVAASEAKLEVNENCIEIGWPCWAAAGSGSRPMPAREVAISPGGEVVFADNAATKTNIAWLGTVPTCSPGVPLSPAPPQTGWEGRCRFEQPGTYRFESSTLFKDATENFTQYEVLVEGGTTVQTNEATEVAQTSATLNATVNPDGKEVTACRFEYGTTTSYGSSVPCAPSPGSGTSPVAVSAAVTALAPDTTYHFRIRATNEGGTSNGSDATFTTLQSAGLNPPEFGRCKKVAGEQIGGRTVYHGQFANHTCTRSSAGAKGKYEWFPGVQRTKFKAVSEGTVLFETVDGKKIACTSEEETGEYASPKLQEPVVFAFKGCEFEEQLGHHGIAGPYPASSEGRETGEIVTEPTECELGVGETATGTTQGKGKLALTCAEEQEFVWLKWKVPGSEAEPELCITGWWLFALKANTMSLSQTLTSTQSKGRQKLVKILESPLPNEDLESRLDRTGNFEQMGLALISEQTGEEEVEANSVA